MTNTEHGNENETTILCKLSAHNRHHPKSDKYENQLRLPQNNTLTIPQLTFQEDLKITAMHSMDGESVPFSESLYPTGNVEDWLLEVERVMRQSILESIRLSVEDYPKVMDRL